MSDRLNVFPSRMVLTALKERIVAAKTGHSLLKRKSDAIKANLNTILREILETKRRLFKMVMRDAAFSHTEAQYYAGNFNSQVIEATKQATFRLKTSIKNIAGVKLPVFKKYDEDYKGDTIIALSSGGRQVVKAKETFTKALLDLVSLATLQTHLKTLDEALKVTNRRVNALEFVILPLLENTIKYIISELDEQEREDNFRIKKVKDIRLRDEEKEMTEKAAEALKKVVQAARAAGTGTAQQTTGVNPQAAAGRKPVPTPTPAATPASILSDSADDSEAAAVVGLLADSGKSKKTGVGGDDREPA